ncbi:MAG: hypothetical protein ACTSV6_07420 [Candidatus Heimdallarchaeota archaeon]
MPDRYIHNKTTELLVGNKCDKTHKIIDYPVKYFGRKHRFLFHDPISASIIGILTNGYKGVCAGLSHIVLDYCCTEVPAFKYMLKIFFYLRKK